MNALSFFNAQDYFKGLCKKNITALNNHFKFCTCSGIESLQGPLDRFKRDNAFFCLDDTNDGALFQGNGGGWYKQRTFTVFLMHRYRFNDEGAREQALSVCRDLFRQLVSRMIVDADHLSNDLVYLKVENILCRELGQYFLNGCTGLYFMIDVSEPVSLKYYPREWQP